MVAYYAGVIWFGGDASSMGYAVSAGADRASPYADI